MTKILYVYILKCSDQSYYTGVSNDPTRRTGEHNSDNYPVSYVHSRRPVELVFVREFDNPLNAIAFEKQVKRWSRAKKDALISGDLNTLRELAACKNKTSHLNYHPPLGSARDDNDPRSW